MTAPLDWDSMAAQKGEGAGREEHGDPAHISLRSLPGKGREWFCFARTQILVLPYHVEKGMGLS